MGFLCLANRAIISLGVIEGIHLGYLAFDGDIIDNPNEFMITIKYKSGDSFTVKYKSEEERQSDWQQIKWRIINE